MQRAEVEEGSFDAVSGEGGRKRQAAFHLPNCSEAQAPPVRLHNRNCFRCLPVSDVALEDVGLKDLNVWVKWV